MRNIFRRKDRKALHDKPGHHNPCSHCWRWKCHGCLVFVLADFSLVMRSDPKLAKSFEQHYNKVRGAVPTTRQERRAFDRNARVREEKIEKAKKAKMKSVN